jgi:hypothetical protein
VSLRLLYLIFLRVLNLLVLFGRLSASTNIELLVLRHEVTVRGRVTPKPALDWADRAVFAALVRRLPPLLGRHRLVPPGTIPASAPVPGRPEMDVSPPPRASTCRERCGLVDRAHGQGESELGIPENPGRAAQTRPLRGGIDDPPCAHAVTDTTGAGSIHRHDMAAIPARAGVDDGGV